MEAFDQFQISFSEYYANTFKWDNEDREASYRDNFADDDELDVFASGDRNTRDLPNGQERG